MKKNSIGYTIDHNNGGTIIMTKAFAKQANIYGTNEYKALVGMLRDFSGYKTAIKTISRSTDKKSYKGLTYENMKTYIEMEDPNALDEFARVLKLSEVQSGKYAYVKTWFLKKYPNYDVAPTITETTETIALAEAI